MGCDIHAMIEGKYHWTSIGAWHWQSCGEVRISRNYSLFAKLADVRNYDGIEPISKPRFEALAALKESDDERCSDAFRRWASDFGVDGHSHSYVTLDELQTADVELAARCKLIVLAHGLDPAEARLVFFFDN